MTNIDDLTARNQAFAQHSFDPALSINPAGDMMVIGCVDPRVDPTRVLGIKHGEAAVIRNVGGRITPQTMRTLGMLAKVGAANQVEPRTGDWNLVILHHTDCGMTDLAAFPALLAEYFDIPADQLAGKSVSDPIGSIRVDTDVVLHTLTGSRFLVSGLVYDVATGLVQTVVPPTLLRSPGQ